MRVIGSRPIDRDGYGIMLDPDQHVLFWVSDGSAVAVSYAALVEAFDKGAIAGVCLDSLSTE